LTIHQNDKDVKPVYHRSMICTSQKWVLCCGMNYSPVGDNCCSLQHCWCIEYHIWVTIITNYHTTVPTNVEQIDNTGESVFFVAGTAYPSGAPESPGY
jgi:hypothetical protein